MQKTIGVFDNETRSIYTYRLSRATGPQGRCYIVAENVDEWAGLDREPFVVAVATVSDFYVLDEDLDDEFLEGLLEQAAKDTGERIVVGDGMDGLAVRKVYKIELEDY